MEFIIPPFTSQTLGVALPPRGYLVILFGTIAPNRLKSNTSSISNPKAPDAGMIGFSNCKLPIFTFKFGLIMIIPPYLSQIQDLPYIHVQTLIPHLLQYHKHMRSKHPLHSPYALLKLFERKYLALLSFLALILIVF